MNLRSVFAFVGSCALYASFPNIGHSELIQTINIRLVARITTQNSTNGNTHIETMKTVRITTKDVLELLSEATSNDFHGATLVSIHRGQAYQVRRGTNILADVSGFFSDDGFSQDVINQNFDSTTGKDTYHGFWLKSITFDDQHGNRFALSGMIEEHYNAQAADSQGMQQVSDSETLTCTGSGSLQTVGAPEGQFALFNGTLILSGKGVVPLNTF